MPEKIPAPLEPAATYAPLLQDLCDSILNNMQSSKQCLDRIQKQLTHIPPRNQYQKFERPYVLSIAVSFIADFLSSEARLRRTSSTSQLESGMTTEEKFENFSYFFHRLSLDDQILLILHDRHSVPLSEIAIALGIPENSIKIRRQQALRTLEEWIWDSN